MFRFLLNYLLKASLSEMSAGKLQYRREGKVRSCSRSKELGKMQLVRKSEQGHWWQGSAPSVHTPEQKHSSNVAFRHVSPFLSSFNSWLFACLWWGDKAPLCAVTQRSISCNREMKCKFSDKAGKGLVWERRKHFLAAGAEEGGMDHCLCIQSQKVEERTIWRVFW